MDRNPTFTEPADELRAHMSPFGHLLTMARLNHLQVRHLQEALGLPASVVPGLRQGSVRWQPLFKWLHHRHSTNYAVHANYGARGWRDLLPYRSEASHYLDTSLRACWKCLHYGYHSLLHQLPWIRLCPWHQTELTTHCGCQRLLLAPSHGRAPHRLMICPCGHDHFHAPTALLEHESWPLAQVNETHTHYLRSVAQLRRYRIRAAGDSPYPHDEYCAILQQTLPVQFVGPSDPIARTFDEATPIIRDELVDDILDAWEFQGDNDATSYGLAISTASYLRLMRMAQLVNEAARRLYNIQDFLGLYQGRIIFNGDTLVHSGTETVAFVDPRVLSRDCDSDLVPNLIALGRESPARAATVAAALDEIATLSAMDHMEGLLHSDGAIAGKSASRIVRRYPVVHARARPYVRITVAMTQASRESSLIALA